jgi:hypothetical protein
MTTILLIFFNLCFLITALSASTCSCIPSGFSYLSDIDSTIIQDIRYYSAHNFIGRRIEGRPRIDEASYIFNTTDSTHSSLIPLRL